MKGTMGLTSCAAGRAYAWREAKAVARIATVNFIAVGGGGMRVRSVDLRTDVLALL